MAYLVFFKRREPWSGVTQHFTPLCIQIYRPCAKEKTKTLKKTSLFKLFSLVQLNARKLMKAYYNIHSKKFIQDNNLFHFAFTKFPQPISN
jgi:hypothetical protein